MKNYIPFNKEEIPQRFEIDLAEESFFMEINYNEYGEFFTVDLFDSNEDPLVIGEKLILGVPLWSDFIFPSLPGPTLIPLDESGKETSITFENFGVSVFVFIDDVIDEGEENGI